jgi:hypothetical protein
MVADIPFVAPKTELVSNEGYLPMLIGITIIVGVISVVAGLNLQ